MSAHAGVGKERPGRGHGAAAAATARAGSMNTHAGWVIAMAPDTTYKTALLPTLLSDGARHYRRA
jgi:hypothetical protein